MAKATNDRYTQFFTPDEFKAFNEALDPKPHRRHRRHDRAGRGDRTASASRTCCRARPPNARGLRSATSSLRSTACRPKALASTAVSGRLRGKAGTVVAVTVQRPASAGRLYDYARRRAASDGRLQDAARRHRIRLGDGVRPRDARRVRYGGRAIERQLGAKALILDLAQ